MQGGRELGVATMKALCMLRDLARKLAGTCVSSPVPDLEDTQGVTGPSGAEVAAQHSSSSRQPAQAVERSMMSNYVLLLQHSCTGRFKWLFPDIA